MIMIYTKRLYDFTYELMKIETSLSTMFNATSRLRSFLVRLSLRCKMLLSIFNNKKKIKENTRASMK